MWVPKPFLEPLSYALSRVEGIGDSMGRFRQKNIINCVLPWGTLVCFVIKTNGTLGCVSIIERKAGPLSQSNYPLT